MAAAKLDHITKDEFLFEFFGNFGRILGNPKRYFTNDPTDILDCIERGKNEGLPAFISVQPFIKYGIPLGIEKIFFDFDYGKKSDKMSARQIELAKSKCAIEVKQFANYLLKINLRPLILYSGNKGYHVYIFFDKVYSFDSNQYNFWKMVYKRIMERHINKDYKFMDTSTIGDLQQFGRIPFSFHQKTNNEVIIVDKNLKPDKIRSLDFYKTYGLSHRIIKQEASITVKNIQQSLKEQAERHKNIKSKWEIEHGFIGKIRPCFTERIKLGEMSHQQRLALIIEAFFSGKKTEDDLVDVFRPFHDFDESITRYQIKWYLEHQNGVNPYRCETIEEKGWCFKEDCHIYRRRHKIGNRNRRN